MATQTELQSRVQEIEKSLKIASNAFSVVEKESQFDTNDRLWELRNAMASASKGTTYLISCTQMAVSDPKLLTNVDNSDGYSADENTPFLKSPGCWSNSDELVLQEGQILAVRIENALAAIVKDLNVVVECTESLLQTSMQHNKKVMEFQNEHLNPRLRRDITRTCTEANNMKTSVTQSLERTRRESASTAQAITEIQKKIAENNANVYFNQAVLQQRRGAIAEAESRRAEAEKTQADYERQAALARERASDMRLSGALVGIFTLGLGFGYTIGSFIEASEESSSADEYATKARGFADEASNLRSSCASLQSSVSSLQETNSRLANEQNNLSRGMVEKDRLQSELLSNAARLQQQVSTATRLSTDITNLEAACGTLSTNAEELRRNLQRLKVNVSECRDCFVEHRDSAALAKRQAKRYSFVRGIEKVKMLEDTVQQILPHIQECERSLPHVQEYERPLPSPKYNLAQLLFTVLGCFAYAIIQIYFFCFGA